MPIRQLVYRILQPAPPLSERSRTRTDTISRVFDFGLMILITLNVIGIGLESVGSIERVYGDWLNTFELVSMIVFTLEYGLRLWTAVETEPDGPSHPFRTRLRYAVRPLAVVDLLVILPYYLTFLLPFDLRALRILRVIWVLKLTRYSAPLTMLLEVLREEAQAILGALFVLLLLLVVAASFGWLAERDAQPEVFGSIPLALWWAVVTMTTLGYGDVVPVTVSGKIVSGVVAIIGVGMVAMPAGLLASGFSDALHRRRRRFEAEAGRLVQDGQLSALDREHLDEFSDRLGLTDRQASEILHAVETRIRSAPRRCPHCGEPLEPERLQSPWSGGGSAGSM